MIKLYTGCHGHAIRRYLNFCGITDTVVDVNFKRISNNTPYDLKSYFNDVELFIFSPVNKKGFDTATLCEEAVRLNIPCISFPWLRWDGYHPMEIRYQQELNSKYQWWRNSEIIRCVQRGVCRKAIVEKVYSGNFLEEDAEFYFDQSLGTLREKEKDLDIQIANYVENNFRSHKLFHWNEHPTNILFQNFFEQLYALIQLKTNKFSNIEHPSEFIKSLGSKEIFPESSIPVMPEINDKLDDSAKNSLFSNHHIFGKRNLSLTDYVNVHFESLIANYDL